MHFLEITSPLSQSKLCYVDGIPKTIARRTLVILTTGQMDQLRIMGIIVKKWNGLTSYLMI